MDRERRSAEPTAPHLGVEVDRVQLADARNPTVVFGSGRGEPDDHAVIHDHLEPLIGLQRQHLAAPVGASVVDVELVEVRVGHHVSIRGLPRTHLDRGEPLGITELHATNRQRHHVHPAHSIGHGRSAFLPAPRSLASRRPGFGAASRYGRVAALCVAICRRSPAISSCSSMIRCAPVTVIPSPMSVLMASM